MHNGLMKKIVAIATVLTVSVFLVGPGVAQALTADELQAQIDALLAQLAALQAQLTQLQAGAPPAGVPTACTGITFDRNLKQGMTGSDVKCLQALLNQSADTQVATTGAGSPGNETSYFGPLTKAAVIKFQEKYASEILASWGLTSGTGFVGSTTRAKLNSLLAAPPPVACTTDADCPTGQTCQAGACVAPAVVPPGAGLTVSLASDTPASSTLVTGQSVAPLAKFTLQNGDNAEAKVTQLKLKRLGVSADTTLSNVYLFDGANRLTDAASVSSGVITFTETAGIVKIAAGGSKTVTVKSDIATGTSGETVGVGINASTDVTSDASSVNGTFPINGNLMSIASGALASVYFNATTTPSAATIDPQNDYAVWQNIVTVGTRAVNLTRISLREIGTINYSDLQNFRLYVDGVQVGTAVANLDANGYVTFDLSASPQKLETGARTIKVVGDIIGGSSRTFSFSLRIAADANFVDSQYNVNVLPALSSTTAFSARTAGTQTVGSGVVTVAKKSDSPSGDIVNTASNATLAKFEIKASGEKVKIETLTVRILFTNTDTTGDDATDTETLRNGALYANGVQIGSTQSITTAAAGTSFSLGSSLIVVPGSPVTLEVRADIYDNAGSVNDIDATDILQVSLLAGSSNAQGQVSLTTSNVPAAAVNGNALTVRTGGLTLSKYTAFPDYAYVPPVTAAKLAHFTLTANTTEAVNLNTITVDIDNVTDAFSAAADLSNLYVKYGTQTTSVKATVAATGNQWAINYQLAVGATIDVIVYADVASGATDGDATTDTGRADVTIAGVTVSSATSTTGGETTGQTISFTSGALSVALDGASPIAQIVAGSNDADIAAGTPKTVTAAKYKFTAARDAYTLKEMRVRVGSGVSGALVNAILKDGATVVATAPFAYTDANANDQARFTGLNVSIPANTTKTVAVDLALSVPSADVSTSQVNAAVTLSYIKSADSQGVETEDDTPGAGNTEPAGNELRVYRSIPTFTVQELPSGQGSLLSSGGTATLYKFKVTADSKDEIALKQLKFRVTITDPNADSTPTLNTFKLFRGTTDITSLVAIQNTGGASLTGTTTSVLEGTQTAANVIVTWTTEERIGAGVSYEYSLKASSVSGVFNTSTAGNDAVSTFLEGDTAHNGTDVYVYDPAGTGTIQQLAGDNSGTGASAYSVIWSDVSAISGTIAHSYTSGSSSNDWADGYLALDLPLDSKGIVAQ